MARASAIDVQALRAEINGMLDLFIQKGVTSVQLDADLYWAVNWGDEYQVDPPKEFTVGSLADDLEFLGLDTPRDPVAIVLSHAAPLLHYLGQQASKYGIF